MPELANGPPAATLPPAAADPPPGSRFRSLRTPLALPLALVLIPLLAGVIAVLGPGASWRRGAACGGAVDVVAGAVARRRGTRGAGLPVHRLRRPRCPRHICPARSDSGRRTRPVSAQGAATGRHGRHDPRALV